MLIKNMDETLVNGSMGRVVRFVDPAIYNTEHDIEGPVGRAAASAAGGGPSAPASKKGSAIVGGGNGLPVVEFSLPHGGRREILVQQESWKVELPNGDVQVSRNQVSFRATRAAILSSMPFYSFPLS